MYLRQSNSYTFGSNDPTSPLVLLSFCGLLTVVFWMFFLVPAYSAKEKADPILCKQKKVSSRGRPNRMRAMASMNSVIQWINKAKKAHGEKYALWHTSFGSKISCDKIKDSDLYICFAAAKPCRLKTKEEEEAERKAKEAKNKS